jgi:four helix bundle protein
MAHSYRDLIAWQKAKRLAVLTYNVTENFPKSETFGLRSQLRRCGVSVVSNIAEGQGRNTKGEFIQFLGHARGSLLELQTQIEIAFDLKYVSGANYSEVVQLSGDVLGLVNRLKDSLDNDVHET